MTPTRRTPTRRTPTGALHDTFERLIQLTRSKRRHEWLAARIGRAGATLTRGESFLLAEIAARAPIRLSDLAVACELERSIASRQADALVRAGLAERRHDPSDGRASLLHPTARGTATLRRLRARREQWLATVLAHLDPDDVDALAAVLPRLVAAIEATDSGHARQRPRS